MLKTALREFLSNSKDEVVEESVTIQESEDEEEQQDRKVEITELIKRLLDVGS